MYLTRSEYDRGVNTFSPEGRLFQVSPVSIRKKLIRYHSVLFRFLVSNGLHRSHLISHLILTQVEYAIEAIKLGSTAVGIQTPYGCVLAVEKRLSSPLLDPSSVEKIAEIDAHVGAAMSGLVADARTLVDHARVEAQNHSFTYDEPIGVEALTQAVCDLALSFGEGSDGDSKKRMSRPFGVALLLAGYDELDGCQLFFSDPSGTFVRYKAKAIGAGSEGAQSNLEESYSDSMTLEEAEVLALTTLKQVMEEKISTDNIELARVTPDKGFHIATHEEMAQALERL
jgi:20S proteasome subunit alpha 5